VDTLTLKSHSVRHACKLRRATAAQKAVKIGRVR
jgi:hypothetical protein